MEIKKNFGGLGHHYGNNGEGYGYDNLEIMIIEQVKEGDTKHLAN